MQITEEKVYNIECLAAAGDVRSAIATLKTALGLPVATPSQEVNSALASAPLAPGMYERLAKALGRIITPAPKEPNKYQRKIGQQDAVVDVYDVLLAFEVTCPAMQHAIKKCLAPGQRGAKDSLQDKREAIASIERSIELETGRGLG